MRLPTVRRRRLAWAGLLLVAGLATTPALAAERRAGDEIVIRADETIEENLYLVADRIVIDGTVIGDVVAAGGTITVNGTIEGDLLAAASAIVINGQLEDARVAGSLVQLGPRARLGSDMLAGAGSVELEPGSLVGGDLLLGMGQGRLGGTVSGDVLAGAGRMQLSGAIDGDADLAVAGPDQPVAAVSFTPQGGIVAPNVPPGLTVDGAARVNGQLRYRSDGRAAIDPGAQIAGGVQADIAPVSPPDPGAPASPLLGRLRQLAALAVVGLLLIWLAGGWTRRLADDIGAQPLPALGRGFAVMVAIIALAAVGLPLVVTLLAVFAGVLTLGRLVALVIGLGLLAEGATVAAALIYTSYVAPAAVALLSGRRLLERFAPAWNERPAVPLLLGLLIYVALVALPVVGWLVALSVAMLGLGALWDWAAPLLRRGRPQAPTPRAGAAPLAA